MYKMNKMGRRFEPNSFSIVGCFISFMFRLLFAALHERNQNKLTTKPKYITDIKTIWRGKKVIFLPLGINSCRRKKIFESKTEVYFKQNQTSLDDSRNESLSPCYKHPTMDSVFSFPLTYQNSPLSLNHCIASLHFFITNCFLSRPSPTSCPLRREGVFSARSPERSYPPTSSRFCLSVSLSFWPWPE